MTFSELERLISESIKNILINEGWYDNSTHPYHSKLDTQRDLGRNPLTVDNGSHASADKITQPSTIDFNGERLGSTIKSFGLSKNGLIIYKLKNFGRETINSTLELFGKSAMGEKSFRNTIDVINGAARRNGKRVVFRTIYSSEKPPRRKDGFVGTFWEFSFDGQNWYIMKPNAVQSMKLSSLSGKTLGESKLNDIIKKVIIENLNKIKNER